jgi:hypothetical protein
VRLNERALAPRRGSSTRRTVLKAGCVAVAAAAAGVLYKTMADDKADAAATEALWKHLEAQGNFAILADDLQKRIGPSVVMPDRPVKITDLGPRRLGPLQSIEAALSPYPPGFVARFITLLALAGDVTFWKDTPVGGFFFPKGICLNAGDPADAGEVTTRLFHHELSSLVRLGAPFDDARWASFNPAGFKYLDEAAYRVLLKSHPHEGGDAALNAQGFVRPYGESDLDNDWNTYAEEAFGNAAAFSTLIRPYPRMQGKTAMLIDVYSHLDPAFRSYFERTGLIAATAG